MNESNAIAVEEQRQAPRLKPVKHLKGTFNLYIEDQAQKQDILSLRDISPFGVGLETQQHIESGKRIRIQYKDRDLTLEVRGTVVWGKTTRPDEAGRLCTLHYQLGVKLHPAEIKQNVHFFRHMTGQE